VDVIGVASGLRVVGGGRDSPEAECFVHEKGEYRSNKRPKSVDKSRILIAEKGDAGMTQLIDFKGGRSFGERQDWFLGKFET
jgi:hypothetical protein